MSADNETLLEIINSVANDLTGADAQVSGVNPNKANLIEKVNDKQKDICNSRDWTFMIDTQSINGYTTSTTEGTISGITVSAGQPADLKSDETGGRVSYWAEKMATSGTKLSLPKQLDVYLVATATGAGAVSGSFQFFICPDSAGNPDISNPVVTSSLYDSTLFSGLTASAFQLFTLSSIVTNDVLLKGTNYWVVVKFSGAADNGDGLAVEYGNITSATTKTRLNNATTWTAFTTGRLRMSLTYYEADYETNLTLPSDVQKVYRLYSGTANEPTNNLKPYSTTNYIQDPEAVPTGYFVVKSANTGVLEIWINPATANQTDWVIEYKKNSTALSGDSDVPVIPRNFRALLKKGVLLYYMGLGLGMQDSGAIALIQAEYDKMLKDMRVEFLPVPSIRMGAAKRSSKDTSSPFLNREPNSWSVK
jgi:hypothetical protein